MRALQVMLSCVFVVAASGTGAMASSAGAMGSDRFVSADIQLAQTQTKQNRDNRQDNRQDCRNAEGVVGGDKRDCKQDSRQDNSQADTKSGG